MPEVLRGGDGKPPLPSTATAATPLPEGRNARGPCCGIIALWNALDVYHRRLTQDGTSIPLLIRKHESNGQSDTVSMRQVAKEEGHSLIGELFYADRVVQLANTLAQVCGLSCRAEKKATEAGTFYPTIKDAISAQRLVMVPYDVKGAGNGDPNVTGAKPHWALAFAYATHWGKFWKWDADALQKSSASLKTWSSQVWEKSGKSWTKSIDKPHAKESRGGGGAVKQSASWGEEINLSETLAMKLVVI